MEDILKTNKDYIENFLNTLEKEFNIHCTKRRFSDGYFIMDYGEDSVCMFKIKEIPDFIFGIWMSSNIDLNYYDVSYKESKLILFTQPIINIDKFRPNRSSFCLPIIRYIEVNEDDTQEYKWWLTEVEFMLKALRKNKIKSFYKADKSDWKFYDEVSYFKALRYYISSYYSYYKDKIIERYYKYIIIFLVKFRFKRLKNVRAYLYNEKYWSPGLNVAFSVKDNITEKEDNKLTKINNWFDKHFFMNVLLREYSEEEYFKLLKALNNDERKDIKNIWMKT